jgi:CBS domain containing-hemolysin-like protein
MELVSNIMDFTDRKISQVMMPLSEVFAVNIGLLKDEIVRRIIAARYQDIKEFLFLM